MTGRSGPDHPYLPHYDWSAIPGVDDERIDPAREAELDQHAADRLALDRGRGVRLLLAAPIVVWSLLGMGVLILAVIVGLLWALRGGGAIGGVEATAGLAGFLAIVIVLEAASIWSAQLLIKDALQARSWLAVFLLAGSAALASGVWLVALAGAPAEAWMGFAAAVYIMLVAAAQRRRALRLAPAEARADKFSP